VVIAEDLPHPADSVIEQTAGASVVAESGSIYGEIESRVRSPRVVGAEDPLVTGHAVLIQIAGCLVLAQGE